MTTKEYAGCVYGKFRHVTITRIIRTVLKLKVKNKFKNNMFKFKACKNMARVSICMEINN